jgi:hypothetical protein
MPPPGGKPITFSCEICTARGTWSGRLGRGGWQLVPRLGLEPISKVLSSLLIVAFHRIYLAVVLHQQPCVCKHYVATICNDGQGILCQPVSGLRLVSGCVRTDKGRDSVSGCVKAGFPLLISRRAIKVRCGPSHTPRRYAWRALVPSVKRGSAGAGARRGCPGRWPAECEGWPGVLE